MTGLRIDSYRWNGGAEAMLRFGPADASVTVVAAPPLLEEANRTRAFLVAILRALAERGIASILPDLPGQGESPVPLDTLSIFDMQSAYAEAVQQAGLAFRGHALGIRSGALLDVLGSVRGRWHFAPQGGPALLRELARIRQAQTGVRPQGDVWWLNGAAPEDPAIVTTIAGNRLSRRLLTDLLVKEPFDDPALPRRTVRLASDPAPADLHVDGPALWRRSEPGNDLPLARLLAHDVADWIVRCED